MLTKSGMKAKRYRMYLKNNPQKHIARNKQRRVSDSIRFKNNIKAWAKYIPMKSTCQICGKIIFFNCGIRKDSIHFDHRHGGKEFIKNSPTNWLRANRCNDKNKLIWDSCDFGILCGNCNKILPTRNRTFFVCQVTKYVFERR
jgi:hypothetical protein